MKFRGVFAIGLAALLVIATGCGANQTATSVSSGADSSAASSSPPVSQAVSSAPDVGSEAENSSSQAVTSSQAQQSVLDQIRAALNTKVPLMLPMSVPVEKGRYLTAATVSQTTTYKVSFYETNQPAEINSQAASKGTLITAVEGTEYKDAASAKENISGYEQVDTSNYGDLLDLGHEIKAVAAAGLGHQYLIWNEGRWCIRMDSSTDPAYKNKEYPDRNQLAKNIVAYLDEHMLPAPQKIGVISINIWNQNDGATVEWQDDQTVYQVSSEDPMTALKIAVAMK